MLVLTRKTNEEIWIGDEIVVKVTQIDRNSVRIAILAPADVTILRGELRDRNREGWREGGTR